MKGSALVALLVTLGGSVGGAAAQVTLQRRAPSGFEAVSTPTIERPLYVLGAPHPEVVFITGNRGTNSLLLAPASVIALTELLSAHGIHARAARIWSQSDDFAIGQSTCLPAANSANCIPATLHARGAQVHLVLEPARSPAAYGDMPIASLGSLYVSGAAGRSSNGNKSLFAGLSTQGMLSRRDTYLEYDVRTVNSKTTSSIGGTSVSVPTLGLAYNLLVAGTSLPGGARGFAGLFRAGGIGGEAAASEFFIRPRMVGIAGITGEEPLQAGSRSRVKVTLLAPARITLSAGGVQVYSAMHEAGEQLITFDGLAGNFVNVVTQDMAGRQERFQVPVSGVGIDAGARALSSWRLEAGRTASDTISSDPAAYTAPKGIVTLLRRTTIFGYSAQGSLQAATGQVLRAGLSTEKVLGMRSDMNDWGAGMMLGRGGEYGASGFGNRQIAGVLSISLSAGTYRPPTSTIGGPCTNEGGALCYSSVRTSRVNLGAKLLDWPVHLGVSASRTPTSATRNILLQGTYLLPFGDQRSRLIWGLRRGNSSPLSFFAFVTFPLGGSTVVSSSMQASAGGSPIGIAAAYSHDFTEDGGWLESIAQSVQTQVGGKSTQNNPMSFTHQLAGRSGPVALNFLASHSGTNMDAQAAISANYGVSASGLAFTRHDQGVNSFFSATTYAAIKIVNDSLDAQMVVVDMRTLEVAPQTSLLIPVPVGYAPDVSVSPGPVTEAARAGMPDYLFASNIKEIRIQRGNWYRARFLPVDNSGDGAQAALRGTTTRTDASPAEQPLYHDSSRFAFLFEPATDGPLVRYITTGTGMAPITYRCEAQAPQSTSQSDMYPELTYRCRLDAAKAPRP